LHRTWTHIRRLVASIMLVAFASFVLHGSAMARPAPTHGAAGMAGHHHDHSAHDHGAVAPDGQAGTQAALDPEDSDRTADAHGQDVCCGSFCATALAPVGRDGGVTRVGTAVVLPAFETVEGGIAPEGLRKPPRTPDIA
jgi:hypothetical protein